VTPVARSRTRAVDAHWLGGYRCRVTARQFVVEVDEPESAGGEDSGLQPTELFLGSLASCFALAISHMAAKRQIELGAIDVRAIGTYAGPRFDGLRVECRVEADQGVDVEELLKRARTVCYVSNTLALGPEVEVVRVES
jgi:organic hydroperoxide reductase OsmC/OhrA